MDGLTGISNQWDNNQHWDKHNNQRSVKIINMQESVTILKKKNFHQDAWKIKDPRQKMTWGQGLLSCKDQVTKVNSRKEMSALYASGYRIGNNKFPSWAI